MSITRQFQATPSAFRVAVEVVNRNSPGEQAGIQAGDLLFSYNHLPITSPAIWLAMQENTVGNAPVALLLQRDSRELTLVIPSGLLGVEVRPELSAEALQWYEILRTQPLETLAPLLEQQIPTYSAANPMAAAWLYAQGGKRYEEAGKWLQAQEAYTKAWDTLSSTGELAAKYGCLIALGRCFERQNAYEQAVERYRSAEEIALNAEYALWQASSLGNLGNVAYQRGNLASAEDYYLRSLAIREHLAPNSLLVASSLGNLGNVAYSRGDLSSAEDYYLRSLTIREHLAPDSLDLARSLSTLGITAYGRGDLSSAEDFHRRALAIVERLAPASLDVAGCLNHLGLVAYSRGDLSSAEDYYLRSLAIRERLAPDALLVASSLGNLGGVAYSRGDLSSAEDYYLRSLAIRERLAPDALLVANSLGNLGNVAYQRGNLSSAEDYYLRSLAIRERLAPDSRDVAHGLTSLGNTAYSHGDLSSAEDFHRRALAIVERLAPASLDVAGCLTNLGATAFRRGDLSSAEDYHRRSLAIRERLAPDSFDVVESLHALASLYPQQPEQALPLFQRALAIVENQRSQIASTELRSLLLARHQDKYLGMLQTYLALGNPVEAFAVVERAHARSLVEMLSERQIDFTRDAPAELLQQQRQLNQQRDQTYSALAGIDAKADANQVTTLQFQLRDLERKQQVLTAAIRQASPHYAALQYPQPLDLAGVQSVLDDGTLLLSYMVGEKETFLFAVTSQSLKVFTLPIEIGELQQQVSTFRQALDVRFLENTPQQSRQLGSVLYQLLLSPVHSQIQQAKRLLLCPDGPLHVLPFAALSLPKRGKARYLGQVKPLHSTLSLTVYALTRQQRNLQALAPRLQVTQEMMHRQHDTVGGPVGKGKRLLALGDPLYISSASTGLVPASIRNTGTRGPEASAPAAETTISPGKDKSSGDLALWHNRGFSLTPLPFSRQEVESIGRLFGNQATLYLGEEATKTAAIQAAPEARILHFACHGVLDHQMPLCSGLVLSQPEALGEQAVEGDNGLLQAWEIFEQVKLKAELVVLSACRSGLGREVHGEGLIGLTRAFTYAGAQSVVVSLWEIQDASTAAFMEIFYEGLAEGQSKAEALQGAMARLSAHPQWSEPFYWSAFLLTGDWR